VDASRFAIEALAFVLTYAIHSTLLLGVACLVARRLSSLALRERVWKAALTGGVFTALLQSGLAWRTPLVHWTLRAQDEAVVAPKDLREVERAYDNAATSEVATATAPTTPELPTSPDAAYDGRELPAPATLESSVARAPFAWGPMRVRVAVRPSDDGAFTADPGLGVNTATAFELEAASEAAPLVVDLETPTLWMTPVEPNAAPTAQPERDTFALAGETRVWTLRGLMAWGAFALLALGGFVAMWLRLARRLRGRVELLHGELRSKLDELIPLAFGRIVRVRLYEAPELLAPLSFGVFQRSICVPPRASVDLAPDEQATMLAHELAHLARRDPCWLSVAWWIERVFFFQPLNRVARAELIEIAELACDDWAARRTGDRLALASCLTRIAGWIVGPPRARLAAASLPATSMAGLHNRSCLTRRIERLLDDAQEPIDERAQRWAGPSVLAALGSLTLVTPGVCAERGGAFEDSRVAERAVTASPQAVLAFVSVDDAAVAGRATETSAEALTEDDAASASDAEALASSSTSSSTSSAPARADDGLGDLAGELAQLDEGIDELEDEVEELREELGDGEFADSLAPTFELLRARVARLRERRSTLERIASALAVLENEPAGVTTVQPTPR